MLQKIESYRITDPAHHYFQSYLPKRNQTVETEYYNIMLITILLNIVFSKCETIFLVLRKNYRVWSTTMFHPSSSPLSDFYKRSSKQSFFADNITLLIQSKNIPSDICLKINSCINGCKTCFLKILWL